MLPEPYFSKELYYKTFLENHLHHRKETERVPGYSYTFLDFKKILFDSPIEYTSNGGVLFVNLGQSLTLEAVKNYMIHGEWDDPSYTPNERKLAYKIHLLENKICELVGGSKNTS